jgi:hypothetical protein
MDRELSLAALVLALLTVAAVAGLHRGRGGILTKLGARDRAQLIVMAYESGLVQPGDR